MYLQEVEWEAWIVLIWLSTGKELSRSTKCGEILD
jgi:hypothetical protein